VDPAWSQRVDLSYGVRIYPEFARYQQLAFSHQVDGLFANFRVAVIRQVTPPSARFDDPIRAASSNTVILAWKRVAKYLAAQFGNPISARPPLGPGPTGPWYTVGNAADFA
jgi:hypothetical protein